MSVRRQVDWSYHQPLYPSGYSTSGYGPQEAEGPVGFGGHATLNDGLISYWKFDEFSDASVPVDRLDSVGSVTLSDTLTKTASTTGLLDLGLAMVNASGTGVGSVGGSEPSAARSEWTWMIWVYPTVDENGRSIGHIFHGGSKYALLLAQGASPSTTVTHSYVVTVGTNATSGNFLVQDDWNLVVGWFDTSDHVWVQLNNGTAVDGGASTFGAITGALGSFAVGLAPVWDGRYDESGFWERTLTTQERTDLWNGGAGLAF